MGWLVPESDFPPLHIYTERSYTGASSTRPVFFLKLFTLFMSHFCLCCDYSMRYYEGGEESMQQRDECTQGKGAASALYDRYASSIFAYEKLYTPSWEDAEDVTLEVFTAALEQEKLSALTERQQLVWLRRVAHNKLVDRYRRAVHLPVIPLEQVMETVRTEEALTPEQMVLRGEELERLYKAVSTLSFFQQQLV